MAKHNQQNDVQEVSTKSTKNEILEAYNTLLSQINEKKQLSLKDIKKQEEEHEVVKRVENLNGDKIAKNIMELKLSMMHELDALEKKMSSEHRQFVDLQASIKIESKNLQDLYEIKKNADSLAALLLAQKECKEKFENEIQEKKLAWSREQEEFEQSMKDEMRQAKKERLRNEEEYNYKLQLDRKKDSDSYELSKKELEQDLEETRIKFQKEFAERENIIKSREIEFKSLQEQVKNFPQELEKKIKDAEIAIKHQLEIQYKYQIDLSNREVEGERKLAQQTIVTLQAKIKEQEGFIKQLTQKADESIHQVQAIALKAIEGNSMRFYPAQDDCKKSQSSTNS